MSNHEADYSKHTNDELRAGIEKATQNEERIAAEDSEEALEASQTQRQAMANELSRRESGATG